MQVKTAGAVKRHDDLPVVVCWQAIHLAAIINILHQPDRVHVRSQCHQRLCNRLTPHQRRGAIAVVKLGSREIRALLVSPSRATRIPPSDRGRLQGGKGSRRASSSGQLHGRVSHFE